MTQSSRPSRSYLGLLGGSAWVLCVMYSGCTGIITKETEAAWQRDFKLATLEGYTEFRGYSWDADSGVAIFQYRLPGGMRPEVASETLAAQLTGRCGPVEARPPAELVSRCPNRNGSSPRAFDEYRLQLDLSTRVVTVMWGDFDSDDEIATYSSCEEEYLGAAGQGLR